MTTALIVVLAAAAALAAVAAAWAVRRGRSGGEHLSVAVEAHGLRLDRLTDALGRQALDDQGVREGVTRVRAALEEMSVRAEERRQSEERGWEAVRRLDAVLLGGAARGRAGENVLHEAFDVLPPGMVLRDFRVNGRAVEFALVLPDGRRMPVDSKWAALTEVEALEAEDDPTLREPLARRVEDEVIRRAREVAVYVEPSLTTPFAVACVPDAAYAACRRAHADAFGRGVVIVPYSTALPVLLSLYALAARHGQADGARACLTELEGLLDAMELTLENKLARATTMLQNAADEWRTHLGKARGSVARGRVAAPEREAGPGRAGSSGPEAGPEREASGGPSALAAV